MACCYLAASMIAFFIRGAELLDIDLHLQYNESVKRGQSREDPFDGDKEQAIKEEGVTMVSISGMTCAACTSTVEAALNDVKGVDHVLVSLPLQEARVFHEPGLPTSNLIAAVKGAGYKAELGERSSSQKIDILRHTQELDTLRTSLHGLGLLSTLIFGLGQCLNWSGLTHLFNHSKLILTARSLVLLGLTATAAVQHGSWIFQHAADAARQGRVNMHSLISVSTLVGISLTLVNILQQNEEYQYFDSIVGVLLIITAGRYMDLLSRRRGTETFEGLYNLLDETNTVKLAKIDRHVSTSILRHGDEIVVEAYSVIPCDCYILEGSTYVNESIITGESYPKAKDAGSLLLAGSRNGSNQVRAAVHQDFAGSFLSQLVKSIELSLISKASTQKRIDIITQYFVSVIFAVAAVACAITFMQTRNAGIYQSTNAAGRRLMTILAAACPCALGLATPCAIMAGIDIAWRKGILLLQGGETMEIIQKISHIVMDKTGTLTLGSPVVANFITSSKWKAREKELASLICAAEEISMASHPLAMAIFKKLLPKCEDAWTVYQSNGDVRDIEEVGGRGVRCKVNLGCDEWVDVCVGNFEFMKENCISGLEDVAGCLDVEGSVVFVGVESELAASVVLRDTARSDAMSTIKALQYEGLVVSMLTGDNAQEAARISQELGISVTASSASPEVKKHHIKRLQGQNHKVMMIGDGMNDGPSLATSDVGIMIAHAILTLIDISRSTMRQISMNIIWALSYNIIAVALAIGIGEPFGVTISPPLAAAMMSLSSAFITVQGLVLRMRLSSQHCYEE